MTKFCISYVFWRIQVDWRRQSHEIFCILKESLLNTKKTAYHCVTDGSVCFMLIGSTEIFKKCIGDINSYLLSLISYQNWTLDCSSIYYLGKTYQDFITRTGVFNSGWAVLETHDSLIDWLIYELKMSDNFQVFLERAHPAFLTK